jgi:hypothetical protein
MNLPPYYPTVKGITDYAVWQLVYPDSLLRANIAGEAVCTLRIDSLGTVRCKYIEANDLDGVIVASCSPKLHQLTFRNVSIRADLNKYTYVHANIREQASWAHSDNKMGATEKAIHLVKAAIA